MNRPALFAALVFGLTFVIAAPAQARKGKLVGVIGGLSAAEIVAGAGYPFPYQPFVHTGPAYYGPPPGCVIRPQRVWTGYGWRHRRIRVCY